MALAALRMDDYGRDDERKKLIAADPRMVWTLRRFFDEWLYPRVLKPSNRADGTIELYRIAIRYWEDVTADPDLADLALDRDDASPIDFVGLLPEWGYSRRGIKLRDKIRIGRLSDNPAFSPLSRITARSHASRIATLLQKAGPRFGPRERTAEILPRCPYVPQVSADFEPKPPFELEQARAIAAACSGMDRPVLPSWIAHEVWWRTRLALFYYTGLRAGTVRALRWSHVSQRKGQIWLKVPRALVKTRKPIEMPLHAQLVELLEQVRCGRPDEDLILPEGCGYRNFLDLHSDLQAKAGLIEEDRQSPHAWRRTHLTQMAELGAGRGKEVAQVAADHADGRTTHEHYISLLVNQFRLRLPPLWASVANDRQSRLFD